MRTVETMKPGAVWLAMRQGSISANRIVQYLSTGVICGLAGVCYKRGKLVTWCSYKAWDKWIANEGGEFYGYSPAHIVACAD